MSVLNSVSEMRREYTKDNLDIHSLNKNPFVQFADWFEEAAVSGLLEPNGMALATADKSGSPSIRMVLLKKFDNRGFVFYTNYESRKAREMSENPQASLLFFWDKLERQIRINGSVEKITSEESDGYFQTRDHVSKLGAWASKQSAPLSSRFSLIRAVAKLMLRYPTHVPLPPHWGGYRLVPKEFEFWQGRKSRLHDRFRYDLSEGEWSINRLYP